MFTIPEVILVAKTYRGGVKSTMYTVVNDEPP